MTTAYVRTLDHAQVYGADPIWLTVCSQGCPNDATGICDVLPWFDLEAPMLLSPGETYTIVVDSEVRQQGFVNLDLVFDTE